MDTEEETEVIKVEVVTKVGTEMIIDNMITEPTILNRKEMKSSKVSQEEEVITIEVVIVTEEETTIEVETVTEEVTTTEVEKTIEVEEEVAEVVETNGETHP